MEYIEILKAIGITAASQIIFFIVLAFIGRQVIEYLFAERMEFKKLELTQQLETFKQNLEKENLGLKSEIDKSIEAYKHQLEVTRLEYQIQFAELQQKRLTVIETLYKLLVKSNRALKNLTTVIFGEAGLTNVEEIRKERLKVLDQTYFELMDYFTLNKIYFTKETCDMIEKLMAIHWDSAWDYTEPERLKAMGAALPPREALEKIRQVEKTIKVEIGNLLDLLEKDFRKMLGVISEV